MISTFFSGFCKKEKQNRSDVFLILIYLLTFAMDFLGKGSGLFLVKIDAKFLTEGNSLGKSPILPLGFSSVALESSFSRDRSIIDLLGLILAKGCFEDKCNSVVLPPDELVAALFMKLLIRSATLPSVRQSDSELLIQTVEMLRRLLRFVLGLLGGKAGGGDGLRLSVDKNRFLGGKAGGLEELLVLSEPSSIDKRLSVDL